MCVKEKNDRIQFLWKQSKQYIILKHENGMKVGALVGEYSLTQSLILTTTKEKAAFKIVKDNRELIV